MRKPLWTWTALLASLVALGSTGGGGSVSLPGTRAVAPAERSRTPAEARSFAAEKTPLSPTKHSTSHGSAEPGSAPAAPLDRVPVSGARLATDSPAIGEQGGAPRFPTGPPQA